MRQVRKYDLVDLVLKVRNFGKEIAFCSKSPQFWGENYCLLIKKQIYRSEVFPTRQICLFTINILFFLNLRIHE